MTNAEKFLKDGVDTDDFVGEFNDFCAMQTSNQASSVRLAQFLSRTIKPILSEDEKAILSNLCKWIIKIGRYDNEICLIDGEDVHEELWYLQDGLFSFIQERRRI